MTDGELKIHSDKAWEIALKYSYTLPSDTRTLAAHIDVALSEARATGRREGMEEAKKIAVEHAEYIEGVGKKHPEDSPSRDRCFARAKSCLAVAAAIRAAMEK